MALKTSNKNRKKEIKQDKISKVVKSKFPKIEFKMNSWIYVGIAAVIVVAVTVV